MNKPKTPARISRIPSGAVPAFLAKAANGTKNKAKARKPRMSFVKGRPGKAPASGYSRM